MLDAATGCIWNPNCILSIQYGGYLPTVKFSRSRFKKRYFKKVYNHY